MALSYTYFPPQYFPPDYFGDLTDSGIKTASAFGAVHILASQVEGLRNPNRNSVGSVVILSTVEAYAFISGTTYKDGEAVGSVHVSASIVDTTRVINAPLELASIVIVGSVIEKSIKTQAVTGYLEILSTTTAFSSVSAVAFSLVYIQQIGEVVPTKLKVAQPAASILAIQAESPAVRIHTRVALGAVAIQGVILYGQGYTQPVALGNLQVIGSSQGVRVITAISFVTVSLEAVVTNTICSIVSSLRYCFFSEFCTNCLHKYHTVIISS